MESTDAPHTQPRTTPPPIPDEAPRLPSLEQLCATASRAVADRHHADQCMCDGWPQNCVAGLHVDSWDTSAWEIGLPAVFRDLEQRIADLPQDYECDPGRGDVRAMLRGLITDAETGKDTSGSPRPHAGELTQAAAGFFQPGRTYTYSRWTFRCGAVAPHPQTGERTAIGWIRLGSNAWTMHSCGEAEWAEGLWVLAAQGGESA